MSASEAAGQLLEVIAKRKKNGQPLKGMQIYGIGHTITQCHVVCTHLGYNSMCCKEPNN